jgi:uncharacterized protein (TIGR02996 family)
MDLLAQHEAFLRAIYDAPDDDTPRLVYADFLQENGDEDRAELIRVQCELAAKSGLEEPTDRYYELAAREWELVSRLQTQQRPADGEASNGTDTQGFRPVISRGFRPAKGRFTVSAGILADLSAARWRIVRSEPEVFGARTLAVEPRLLLRAEHIELLLSLSVTQPISEWNLAGYVLDLETVPPPPQSDSFDAMIQMTGFHVFPAIATTGLNVLAWYRGARRITSLDLRNNNLDNDAARAITKSPFLNNLKRLELYEGNQFRGRVWQQVIARFGEDVVG